MGLYQRAPNAKRALLIIFALVAHLFVLSGCDGLQVSGQDITVSVTADGNSQTIRFLREQLQRVRFPWQE